MTDPYITVATGDKQRVKVSKWDAPSGRTLVCISPEHRDGLGSWRLSHSSISMLPSAAAEVATAIGMIAADMGGSPPEPQPTPQDRDESRMP